MTRAPARAAAAYGHAAQAVPPLRQVVMLYDGAIRKVGEAKLAIAELYSVTWRGCRESWRWCAGSFRTRGSMAGGGSGPSGAPA
jgi:hypothetical protein